MRKFYLGRILGLGLGLLGLSAPAQAIQLDFQGRFQYDNDLYRLNLDLATDSTVRFVTSSWARGGFDPVFTLWDSLGRLILLQDDFNPINLPDPSRLRSFESNGVTYTSGDWDIDLDLRLAAGTYTIALAQYDNRPLNYNRFTQLCEFSGAVQTCELSQGFEYDGPDHQFFTRQFSRSMNPSQQCLQFCGISRRYDPRTPDWQLHLNIDADEPTQTIPESMPSAMIWLGVALGGVLGWGRQRQACKDKV